MIEVISNLVKSKTFLLCTIVALFIVILYAYIRHLDSRLEHQQLEIKEYRSSIEQLQSDLAVAQKELDLVRVGLSTLESYSKREKEIIEESNNVKESVIEKLTDSEETKDWWSSPIPDDLLDALTCDQLL